MEELAEIRKRTDLEIEAFVHGAMCISSQVAVPFPNHMSGRDANPVVVVHSLVVGNMTFTTYHSGQERKEYQR